ncbi:MAG: hypothetical protein ACI841_002873 [Planctomycetota bacterium]|jgi:hypothetical protein
MMDRKLIRDRIAALLELIGSTRAAGPSLEQELAHRLDALALVMHGLDIACDIRDYADPPVWTYEERRRICSERFPFLGFYNDVSLLSTQVGEGEAVVADAIDDLADIASELEAVSWRWNNTSVEDALWHLQESYRTHWGRHLRGLQLYLHSRASAE